MSTAKKMLLHYNDQLNRGEREVSGLNSGLLDTFKLLDLSIQISIWFLQVPYMREVQKRLTLSSF